MHVPSNTLPLVNSSPGKTLGGETGSDVVAVSLATHLVIGSVIVFFLPRSGSGSEAAAAAGA